MCQFHLREKRKRWNTKAFCKKRLHTDPQCFKAGMNESCQSGFSHFGLSTCGFPTWTPFFFTWTCEPMG